MDKMKIKYNQNPIKFTTSKATPSKVTYGFG